MYFTAGLRCGRSCQRPPAAVEGVADPARRTAAARERVVDDQPDLDERGAALACASRRRGGGSAGGRSAPPRTSRRSGSWSAADARSGVRGAAGALRSVTASCTRRNSPFSRYRMPPWIMCEDAADAPLMKSSRSTSATSTPCSARSRNVASPLMPPPMIRTSAYGRSRSVVERVLRAAGHRDPPSWSCFPASS